MTISNTSPLLYLHQTGHLDLLKRLDRVVNLAPAVQSELHAGAATRGFGPGASEAIAQLRVAGMWIRDNLAADGNPRTHRRLGGLECVKDGRPGSPMMQRPKHVRKLLREQAARALEAELGHGLGELAEQLDLWRAGQLDTWGLDQAVHHYHQKIAREVWKRDNSGMPELILGRAVSRGFVDLDSLPAEVREIVEQLIAPLPGAEDED